MLLLLSPEICRYIILDQDVAVLEILEKWSARGDEIMLSAITYAELVAGALNTTDKEKHMSLVKAFCERLDAIVPWDESAVDQYTEIQIQALRKGSVTNMNNTMLAAHAICLDARLLCINRRTFTHIEGVKLLELKELS
ncbi:MAG: type II toxin-antitoxin system VapC family toxin [Pseudohongiellaceae bacterium]